MTTHNTKYTKKETEKLVNDQYFQEFITLKNLQPNTIKQYKTSLLKYQRIHGQTLTQLIQEAEQEEEQGTPTKHRKIKQRFITFKIQLQKEGYKTSTINSYLTNLRTIYSYYEIAVPKTIKNDKVKKTETYKDIPTKEHIQQAIESAKNNKLKAVILFMASSGTAAQETCNITIQDFIDATSDYHNETRIENVIFALSKRNDIVPTFTITRQKTGVPYFTFCTPEATNRILIYLRERLLYHGIEHEERLFNCKPKTLQQAFIRLNDGCGFGWAREKCRFFHTHALRKFFGTTLFEEGNVSELFIDFLEGRSISKTRQAYYKPNPEKFKKRYVAVMNCVTINSDVEYLDITSEEKKELLMYREREKVIDEKIRMMEQLLEDYMSLS